MKTIAPQKLLTAALLAGVAMVTPVQAEELEQALVKALHASEVLKAQGAQTEVLKARKLYAVGGYLPEVMFDYSGGKGKSRFDGGDWQKGSVRSNALTLSQPLVNVAALRDMSAAKRRVAGGEERFEGKRQDVLLAAVEAYTNLAVARESVKLHQDDVARLKAHVLAEEERFKAGVNTRTDIRQAEARLGSAEARLARAKGAMEAAEAGYVAWVGHMPAGITSNPPGLRWGRCRSPTPARTLRICWCGRRSGNRLPTARR